MHGTPAARYLADRGIDLARLLRPPRALRYHPSLWNVESQRFWPGLCAAIVRPSASAITTSTAVNAARMVAVHRTWLERQADGSVRKAPLAEPKMTLGSYRGGVIPLARGVSGKPLAHAPDGDHALISEGIEDGLSAAVECPELRVLAAVSLGNMGAIALPAAIRTVTIAAQNDPWWSDNTGRLHGTVCGLDRALRLLQCEGREVRLARPSEGFKDFNELLQAAAA